jgi:cobalt/nickel transport system permease protein
MLVLGPLTLTGGIISMVTLMLKGILCLTASFLLAATTPVDSLCYALLQIRMPRMIVTLFLLTFRYVFVMLEEAAVMTEAYQLRAPGQKGIHYRAWGSFLGQLLLRSMDRAGELYESMLLRGFDGSFRYASGKKPGMRDILFPVLMITMFLVFRFNRVADLLGALVLRGV